MSDLRAVDRRKRLRGFISQGYPQPEHSHGEQIRSTQVNDAGREWVHSKAQVPHSSVAKRTPTPKIDIWTFRESIMRRRTVIILIICSVTACVVLGVLIINAAVWLFG